MPDINHTLLKRVAHAALVTTLVQRSAGRLPTDALAQAAAGAAASNAPISDAQAMTALRQAVASWLRVFAAAPAAGQPRPELPRVVAAAPASVAGGEHPAHAALRNLVGELAAALAAATAGAHNRQAFEAARTALLQALDARLLASAAPRDGDNDAAPARPAPHDNAWAAFSWLNQPTAAGSPRAKLRRASRNRSGDAADDEAPDGQPDTRDSLPGYDDRDLMDIMEWLQRQPADGDYGALLRGERPAQRAGQMLHDSV